MFGIYFINKNTFLNFLESTESLTKLEGKLREKLIPFMIFKKKLQNEEQFKTICRKQESFQISSLVNTHHATTPYSSIIFKLKFL
jgi:hypothetical protein